MTTAWVRGPDRGLEPEDKESVKDWPPHQPVPKFQPDFESDPDLRAKVNSSSYGTAVPRPKSPVKEEDPAEIRARFVPDMKVSEAAVALREKVPSTAYGEKTPQVPPPAEAPKPSFTPEIVRTKEGQKLMGVAVSTHYGTVIPAAPAIREPELPSFRPDLNVSREASQMREKTPSSKYGVELPPRPETAPSSSERPRYERMHTLLEDRTEKPERPKSPDFVLDAFRASFSGHNLMSPFKAKPLPGFNEKDKRPGSASKEARSSNYGKVTPEVKKATKPILLSESLLSPTRDYSGDVAAWNIKVEALHQQELGPLPERSNVLSKDPSSSGYGQVSPTKGERLSVSTEPLWAPVATPIIPVRAADLPTPARNKLNDQVSSTRYGTDFAIQREKQEIAVEPVWIPPTTIPKELPPLTATPRSKKYDWIGSHYGSAYSPKRSSPTNGEYRESNESPTGLSHRNGKEEDDSY